MDLSYTDLLLVCVLWFQVANLLLQLWPKLMHVLQLLRGHGKIESKEEQQKTATLDSYEEWLKSHGGETKQ